jgi:hypothetical protein
MNEETKKNGHLTDDQVFDLAIAQIDGIPAAEGCTCASCLDRIERAKAFTAIRREKYYANPEAGRMDVPFNPLRKKSSGSTKKSGKIIYSMAGLLAAASVTIILLLTVYNTPTVKKNSELAGSVVFTSGEVLINGKPAAVGVVVRKGDSVETKTHSTVTMQFSEASIVALSEKSVLVISDCFSNNDKPTILLEQRSGISFNKIKKGAADFSIRSSIAVAAVRGTSFTFSSKNGYSDINLLDGVVMISRISASAESVELLSGNAVRIESARIGTQRNLSSDEKETLEKLDTMLFENIKISSSESASASATNIVSADVEKILAEKINKDADSNKITLAELKAKYGLLSRVQVWSGRIYVGAFSQKGKQVEIVTVDGVVRLPADKVNRVSPYTE